MRRPLIAGNWKMNLDRADAVALGGAVVAEAGDYPAADLFVCPPIVYLDAVAAVLRGSRRSRWVRRTFISRPTGPSRAKPVPPCSWTWVAGTSFSAIANAGTSWAKPTRQSIKTVAALAAGLDPDRVRR